jgi:hypothetical protein
MVSFAQRLDPGLRERLRRRLLQRRASLAIHVGDVLAGRDKTAALSALSVLRPGIRADEALRSALDQVERRRIQLVSDDDSFGRCDVCRVPLRRAVIEDAPWADRCEQHDGLVGQTLRTVA